MKDYYKILKVTEDTTPEVIKSSYRALALRFHPDRNMGNEKEAEGKMKVINEAYETLGDPVKRREYDLARRPVFQPAQYAYFYYNTGTATSDYGIGGMGFHA